MDMFVGGRWQGSSEWLDVVAPGVDIVSLDIGSGYQALDGTSMATAVTSGVVALMLQAHPELTPDQVKFRLMYTARPALAEDEDLVYNIFQQGMGRIWAPDAVLADLPDGQANYGMDIQGDLDHGIGWTDANANGLIDPADRLVASTTTDANGYYLFDDLLPGRYTVRSGDTLSGIASRHRVSVANLRRANGLSTSRIYPGNTLKVPGSGGTATVNSGSSATTTYRVRKGDTLYDIAREFGVSVSELRRLNGLSTSRIYPGDVLKIPQRQAAS